MKTRNSSQCSSHTMLILPEKISKSVIKLHMPSKTFNEIYDLAFLELESTSSSSSTSTSPVSSSPTSLFSAYSNCSNTNNTHCSKYTTNHITYKINSTNSTPRSSITSTTSYQTDVLSSCFDGGDLDEQLTFSDFVSTIVNSEDKQSHMLIIQDIARLMELKFREFKKALATNNSKNILKNIYMDTNSEIFIKIAEKLFRLAGEEPNGILGTRIKLNLMFDNDKLVDVCQFFPYDSKTFATSEITVTIKEDVTKMKKFLQAFNKVFTNSMDRYLAIKIDSNNFDIAKKKLY